MAALQSSMYAGSATSGTKARGNVHVSVYIIWFYLFHLQKSCSKTMIKPADHAYFSVADGYLQHGMQGNQTNVIRFCQLSIQFLGRIKWSMFANFKSTRFMLLGKSQWNSPEFSTWYSHTSGITEDLLYKAWFIPGSRSCSVAISVSKPNKMLVSTNQKFQAPFLKSKK